MRRYIRFYCGGRAVMGELLPEVVRDCAEGAGAIEVDHSVPIGPPVNVGEQGSIGNLADYIGISFQTHQESSFAQCCNHVALITATFGGGHRNFSVVNRWQGTGTAIVMVDIIHEPLGTVVEVIVLHVEAEPLHVAWKREVGDVLKVRVTRF